jgi:hypothetical protein
MTTPCIMCHLSDLAKTDAEAALARAATFSASAGLDRFKESMCLPCRNAWRFTVMRAIRTLDTLAEVPHG